MSNQPRVVKVLLALLVSMTVGAVVLMALSGRPPLAGPFSLASYVGLDPIAEAVRSRTAQHPDRWRSIEIHFTGTSVGNIEHLASLYGLSKPEDINCHFVVCNGQGAGDGQVLSTEKWQRQWSIIPSQAWNSPNQTIRIYVIADRRAAQPTEYQIKRTYALVDELYQKFSIHPKAIHYPKDW